MSESELRPCPVHGPGSIDFSSASKLFVGCKACATDVNGVWYRPVEQWNSAWCWKEIDRLTKERDLAREMLIGDTSHVSCGIFQQNQQKKMDRLEVQLRRKDEALRLAPCHCNPPEDYECSRCAALKAGPQGHWKRRSAPCSMNERRCRKNSKNSSNRS